MKTLTKNLALGALMAAAGLTLSSGAALAQSVGEIATGLRGQATSLAQLLTVGAFVLGVFLAILGLWKFYQNTQNQNDPSSRPINAFVLIIVGGALIAIPTVLGSGIETIFGSSASTTDAVGGFDRLR